MVNLKRVRVAIKPEEITASNEALEALLRTPPPPPRETITLAKAVGELAPKILELLDAGHSIEAIAERIRFGGKPMLAAALKRYMAACGGRRSKSKGRRTKGTTPVTRDAGQSVDSSSRAISVSGDPNPSNRPQTVAEPTNLISTLQLHAMQGNSAQPDVLRPTTQAHLAQQSQQTPAPLAPTGMPAKPSQSTDVPQPTTQPGTSRNPMQAPSIHGSTVPASTSRAPTPSSTAFMAKQSAGIRTHPSLDLRQVAAARMDRAPPPGFEQHAKPQAGNNSTAKEDPPF